MRASIGCGLLFLTIASPAFAQPGRIAGPAIGYAFDREARAVRPILGIPGASMLGAPVELGIDAESAAISPRQDSVIVIGSDRLPRFFRLQSGTASAQTFEGSSGVTREVAFSPSGTAAALLGTDSIQVVTGLPDHPAADFKIDLSRMPLDRLRATRSAMAVSDDGAWVLVAAAGTVRLYGISGEARSLMSISDGALVSFAPSGTDAAIADAAGAGLVLYRDLAGSPKNTTIASAERLASPVGLAFSSDGRRLFLAGAAGSVSAFDVVSGARSEFSCNCEPALLAPMGELLRLTHAGSGPLWLLDPRPGREQIVFVPAARSE